MQVGTICPDPISGVTVDPVLAVRSSVPAPELSRKAGFPEMRTHHRLCRFPPRQVVWQQWLFFIEEDLKNRVRFLLGLRHRPLCPGPDAPFDERIGKCIEGIRAEQQSSGIGRCDEDE